MGRADKLDAALGDGAGGKGFLLHADFVNHDHFRHVVFDRFDHHGVLQVRLDDLHPAGASNRRVRDVAVAGDLVGRVHNDDALLELVGQNAGDFAQLGRLAASGPAQHQNGLAGLDNVSDNINRAVDGPADAAGQADDAALPVPNGGDPVQGALDAGPVVFAEHADAGGHIVNVLGGHGNAFLQPKRRAVGKPRFGVAA